MLFKLTNCWSVANAASNDDENPCSAEISVAIDEDALVNEPDISVELC